MGNVVDQPGFRLELGARVRLDDGLKYDPEEIMLFENDRSYHDCTTGVIFVHGDSWGFSLPFTLPRNCFDWWWTAMPRNANTYLPA